MEPSSGTAEEDMPGMSMDMMMMMPMWLWSGVGNDAMMSDIPLSFLFKRWTSKDGSGGVYVAGLLFCFAMGLMTEIFQYLQVKLYKEALKKQPGEENEPIPFG